MFNLGEPFLFALSARLFIYFFIFFSGDGGGWRKGAGCRDVKAERKASAAGNYTPYSCNVGVRRGASPLFYNQ